MNAAVPDVFAPARLGPLRLRNRVIKAAVGGFWLDESIQVARRLEGNGSTVTG